MSSLPMAVTSKWKTSTDGSVYTEPLQNHWMAAMSSTRGKEGLEGLVRALPVLNSCYCVPAGASNRIDTARNLQPREES